MMEPDVIHFFVCLFTFGVVLVHFLMDVTGLL